MSRCPDALLCETLFDKVIPRVAEKIDLSLAYIARYFTSTAASTMPESSFVTDSIHQIQNSELPASMDGMNVPEMCNSSALQSMNQ